MVVLVVVLVVAVGSCSYTYNNMRGPLTIYLCGTLSHGVAFSTLGFPASETTTTSFVLRPTLLLYLVILAVLHGIPLLYVYMLQYMLHAPCSMLNAQCSMLYGSYEARLHRDKCPCIHIYIRMMCLYSGTPFHGGNFY